MSNAPSQPDQLQALVASILEGLAATKQTTDANAQAIQALAQSLAESKQRTDSNAKSIQALTDAVASDREKWRQERKDWAQDRRRVFEWMARLAAAQADFYEMQGDHLSHLEQIDERLASILERLTQEDDREQA